MLDTDNVFTVKLNIEYKNLFEKEEDNIVPSFNSIKTLFIEKSEKIYLEI